MSVSSLVVRNSPCHAFYLAARERHPCRRSRHKRTWSPIAVVTLDPERETVASRVDNGMDKSSQVA